MNPTMYNNTPVPIYIEHVELGNTKGMNTQLDLCTICEKHVPGQVLGAQWSNGIWSIWLKNDKAQFFLVNTVKTINIYKHKVEIHGDYPTSKPAPNEKILFKDIPIDISDEDILRYLHNHPGIVVKTDVIHGRIRDEKNNMLTQFLSGDRFVYVKGKFSPALHSLANINSGRCRIFHASQKNACMRCRHHNHSTTETEQCEAYSNDQNVLIVKSPKYPMSNYFPCHIKMHNIDFPSSEHAYQWRFLMYIDKTDLADEVLKAPTAAEAKSIASRVPRHLHKDWHSIKKSVMKEILHIKADYCAHFKQSLLDSLNCRIVEAVQGDLYWSSGLSPYLASTTKSKFYPGMNELGGVLEAVRLDLIKEALLSREFELDNRTDNEMQPPTTKSIESEINTLSNDVSDSYDPPLPLPPTPPPPSLLHNYEDEEHLPPPPLLPQELTHPNELLPDCVQRTNSDDHTQHPSLKTTTDKISLHDTEDDSNKASYKVKSDKVKKKIKKIFVFI